MEREGWTPCTHIAVTGMGPFAEEQLTEDARAGST
jgi:hypothetical protein